MVIHIIALYIVIAVLIIACISFYNTKHEDYDNLYEEKLEIEYERDRIEEVYLKKIEKIRKDTRKELEKCYKQIQDLKINKISTLQDFVSHSKIFAHLRQNIISSFLTLFPSESAILKKIFNTKTIEICVYNDKLYISLQLNNYKHFLSFKDYPKIISKISQITTIEELEILFKDFDCSPKHNYVTLPM